MKKKGFIFVETIVVLVIVVLSLTMILASYSLVTRKNNINKYYNRPNEMYALYYVMKLGTTESSSYYSDINTMTSFYTKKSSCASSVLNNYLRDCNSLLGDLKITNIGIIKSINSELSRSDVHTVYSNGVIEFLKHLQRDEVDEYNNKHAIPYAIGVFEINREYYYAAIRIGSGETNE